MPLQFWWRPNNSPVASASANRVNIGLELGGDDTSISGPTQGRIEVVEVGGAGSTAGSAESASERLLARFHGTFHRRAGGPTATRITFQIDTGATAYDPNDHQERVQGYDPECIIGVDALVLTFLNREFRVNFPFFVDTRSEGRFIEIQAVAKTGTGSGASELRRSAVLNLRIRRQHEVATTSSIGSSPMRYTGNVVGNLILHHEDYILKGAQWSATGTPPATVNAEFIPVPSSGSAAIAFQAYSAGDLKIILLDDLLDDLIPEAAYFQGGGVTGVTNPTTARSNTRTRVRDKIKTTLREIFEDAGFAGVQAHWQNESAVSSLVTSFQGTFHRRTVPRSQRGWELASGASPLSIPFWTFFVGHGSLSGSTAGTAEHLTISNVVQTSSKHYMLPYPAPIGSGNKDLEQPILIKAGAFEESLTRDEGRTRTYGSAADYNAAVDAMSAAVAIVIAHEVAHSIGQMHDMLIRNSGPYSESAGAPVLSIMSSSIEDERYGSDMRFSHQAKVIWERAFSVSPNWSNTYLQNKTWGDNWNTVDWSERLRRFFRQHGVSFMRQIGLLTIPPATPPFAGAGSSAQRGTHVPAPSSGS